MNLTASERTACINAAAYLMGLGAPPLPRHGAIATTAVLFRESKLNPGSQGMQPTEHGGVLNEHGAYGIASWNGPRQAKLQAFAKDHGLPVDRVDTQLRFVITEIADSYPRVWEAITNPALAYTSIIPIIVAEYENPADHVAETNDAIAIANDFAPFVYTKAAPAPTQPTVPAPTPSPTPSQPPGTTTTMNPILLQIITAVVQAVISSAFQIHTTTTTPTTSTPAPSTPLPTQPGSAVNWSALIQEFTQSSLGQSLLQALTQQLQPK